MADNTEYDVPEGYTEDEMGLLRDPDSIDGRSWSSDVQPPVEPVQVEIPSTQTIDIEDETRARRRGVVIKVVVAVVILLVAVGAVGGFMLYGSANNVKAIAYNVQDKAPMLKDAFLEGDEEALRSTAASIQDDIKAMDAEVSSPLWAAGEMVPVVGTDVKNVRTIVSCAEDLSDNALTPLVDGLAGIKFSSLMDNGRINTDVIRRMRDSVVAAAPVIVKDADTISSLPNGSIGSVNELIGKVRGPIADASGLLSDADGLFTTLLRILGDGGQTRTYVLVAQANSEIRSAGGFPGSVGRLTINNGNIELGDFVSIYDLKTAATEKDVRGGASEEEIVAFYDSLAADPAAITYTPNFLRSGELLRDFWEASYGEHIDGVFGLDPVFVQRMLGVTGGIVAEDGTEINGDNAAAEVLSAVYWRYGDDYEDGTAEEEDAFFNDVAHKSAEKILSSMGNVDFDAFFDVITRSGEDRHAQAWMADPQEEELLRRIGISGELSTDRSKPELGVYANDNTWSKISWYLNIWADIDDGVRNEDGSITYNVTAHFHNNMTAAEADDAPVYVRGNNPDKRSRGDMIDTIFLMAPLGGTISEFEVHMDSPLLEEIPAWAHGAMRVYDRDTRRTQIHIDVEGDTTATFKLTMPADIPAKPTVRTSPLCHV